MDILNTEERIAGILAKEKEDHVSSVAADIMRALVLVHGSAWQSDLMDTLTGLWTLKDANQRAQVGKEDLVQKALRQLNAVDLIQSEKRFRSDLGRQEPVEEVLHTAKNLQILIRGLASDPLIARYRREIMGYGTLHF